MQKLLFFIENTVCGAFLPTALFISGAVLFVRLARYVFAPHFFFGKLKEKRRCGKSAFSSLWLALGGTLGVGNICGVAAAIYVGGAGCVFWIWVCAILSSVTKYAETVLAVHFRKRDGSGSAYGGAHSYIESGLGAKKLSVIFCVLCIVTAFTMGNVTQVKAASDFALTAFGIPRSVTSTVFFCAVLLLTIGRGNAIKAFTSRAVPLLCVLYTVCCLAVTVVYSENIAAVTHSIFTQAFNPQAGISGFFAFLCSPAVRLGITRGVMSNEAGCGTAPIAYAADRDAEAVSSGLLGMIEVLVDTLLLCTLTAYALLLPGIPLSADSATSIISAFSHSLGAFIAPVMTVSVFLFALASVSAWSFYALESAKAIGAKKRFGCFFTALYSATAFFGCLAPERLSWLLSDLTVSFMAIINLTAVMLLCDKVSGITKSAYKTI